MAPVTTSAPSRTPVQWAALAFGIGFILAAIAGTLQGGMSMDPNPETAPKVLGLFPVNVIHNAVHLVFGIWGVVAARTFAGARTYAKITGVVYVLLVPLGFVFPTGFGLIPLGGNDPWLHVVLGLPLALFGFLSGDTGPRGPVSTAPDATTERRQSQRG